MDERFPTRRHLCPARALAVGFAVASGDLPSELRPSAHAPARPKPIRAHGVGFTASELLAARNSSNETLRRRFICIVYRKVPFCIVCPANGPDGSICAFTATRTLRSPPVWWSLVRTPAPWTYPPDFLIVTWHDTIRCHTSITFAIPFFGKLGISRRQIIYPFNNNTIGTTWTIPSMGSV